MEHVIVVAIVFSVPISAILSGAWLRAKKLELQSGGDRRLAERVERLAAENDDLRKRVEVLETIVTSDAPVSRTRVRVGDGREAEGQGVQGAVGLAERERTAGRT